MKTLTLSAKLKPTKQANKTEVKTKQNKILWRIFCPHCGTEDTVFLKISRNRNGISHPTPIVLWLTEAWIQIQTINMTLISEIVSLRSYAAITLGNSQLNNIY